MKEKIYNKILSNSGESIAETLVALLIAALGLVMLAGAVTASFNIVKNSKDKMTEYYDESESLISSNLSDLSSGKAIVEKNVGVSSEIIQEIPIKYGVITVFGDSPVVYFEISPE